MALRFQPARGASVFINSVPRGPTGAAATITAGTTTTRSAGNSATVSNSGSSSAAIFDFGIPRGADAGIKWLYDSSTSMADPGSGDIRFNNATISSVTAITVSATGSGVDVSDYVATWDDSTNPAKGHIIIREEAGGVAAVFSVTSVTDNTTWLQLAVTYVSGSLSLAAADPVYVVPLPIGNKGADGTGIFPGSSTDNAVVRFDGVGGGTVQNSSVTISDTGDITANSILLGNTGLDVYDTNGSHSLKLKPGSDLTANRIFTLTTGDAARTLTISGDHTLPGGTSAVLAGAQTITGGFKTTPYAAGTKSTGTYTPLYSDGNFQTATNGGAHTLAPPADDCTIIIQYTNNASAGAITTSGFTKKTGDTITTTNGDDFFFFITKVGTFSHLHVQALQ